MSENSQSLRRKIASAGDLQSVVRSMKALAASSIGQYENSVQALSEYYRTVELGLGACLRTIGPAIPIEVKKGKTESGPIGAIVFGSDQGLVGQFNEVVAEYAIKNLSERTGQLNVWAVGEKVHALLVNADLPLSGLLAVPNSVQAIIPLVGRIQIESESDRGDNPDARVYVFHNRPQAGGLYGPVIQRLLPLDESWQSRLSALPWATTMPPQIIGARGATPLALVREYLFISLFRACAESLASENASRLAAMERADRNIDELLGNLKSEFHRLRQSGIDEELFDVISGFESLSKENT
ncbi:MAG: F0F1 ATP synthase subunit gamma [Fibrobacteria bacterium]